MESHLHTIASLSLSPQGQEKEEDKFNLVNEELALCPE